MLITLTILSVITIMPSCEPTRTSTSPELATKKILQLNPFDLSHDQCYDNDWLYRTTPCYQSIFRYTYC
jgi:hypothetical protein